MKKKTPKTTTRVVGKDLYLNAATGELLEMAVMEVKEQEKDSNFHKIFLNDFIEKLDRVTNQKTKLVFWILSNLTKDNLLLYTYREIADKTGISYGTVADTMKHLLDADFLRKHSSGYYIINPNIIFKGTMQRRCIALNHYREATAGDQIRTDELRLRDISKKISRLKRQENLIREELDILKTNKKEEEG